MTEIETFYAPEMGKPDADFCFIATGDSMKNAHINDGDIVFIHRQEHVNNGEIAAVMIDNAPVLKRFFYYENLDMIVLKSENTRYQDMIYTGEALNHVQVLGKAVAIQSRIV